MNNIPAKPLQIIDGRTFNDIYTKITAALPASPVLDDFLAQQLPGLIRDIQETGADRRVSADEAKVLIGRVSAAVKAFPALQGIPARNIAIAVYVALFDILIFPRLPWYAKLVAPFIKSGAINILETVYRQVVKKS